MTNPTADAKLLPCPFCGGEAILGDVPEENGVAVGCKNCLAYGPVAIHVKEDATHHAIYCWNRRANTRPQPAPPEGEPDLRRRLDEMYVIYGAAHAALSKLGVPAMNGEIVIELEERIRRLGLAARPKVEDADADVATLCDELRRPSGIGEPLDHAAMSKAADLLERLATKVTSLEARDLGWSLQCQEAESNLADLEAELAKADAGGFKMTPFPGFRFRVDEYGIVHHEPIQRAARQQQKASAEAHDCRYVCINGHDRCAQMYPGPECPYCERRP